MRCFISRVLPAAIAALAGGAIALSWVAGAGVAGAGDPPPAPAAAESGEGQRYLDCVRRARENPKKAFYEALDWTREKAREKEGDFASRHCLAITLIAVRNFPAAAELFGELLEELDGKGLKGPNTVTTELLRQAGQAWMLAGENERAAEKFTALLAMFPNDVDAITDRGIVLAETGRYWEALDDLNRALDLAPDRIEVYILRANAYRMVNSPELALDDIERALEREPRNADALFERGLLRKQQNDIEGARSDLQNVLLLAPRTPLARSARANLRKLNSPAAR